MWIWIGLLALLLVTKRTPAQPAHATTAAGGGRVVSTPDSFSAYVPGLGSVRIGQGGFSIIAAPSTAPSATNPTLYPTSGLPTIGAPDMLAADAPTPAYPTDAVPPDAPDPRLIFATPDPTFMAIDPAPIAPDPMQFDPSLAVPGAIF